MGFRFRKSFNLGGGFRVNISNSGVGYSWGTKRLRVTKTAKGNTRVTRAIPGTGISYSKEVGGNSSRKNTYTPKDINKLINNNYYDTQEIKNADASTLSSEGLEGMLIVANKALSFHDGLFAIFLLLIILALFFSFMWVIVIIYFFLFVIIDRKNIINLEYSFEDNQAEEVTKKWNHY